MNSDIWLPTAPARMMLTKPPVNTESALRMHANQTCIEAAQTEHSGRTELVRPHHLIDDVTCSPASVCHERSESLLVSRLVFTGDLAGSNLRLWSDDGQSGTYRPRFSASLFCRVTYSLDQSCAQPTN